MKRRIGKDSKGAVSMLIALLIVAVLLAISLAGIYYLQRPVNEAQDIPVVEEGDTVKVDYIGTFEDGRVFDTTLYDVAKDNITYPKAVSFELKEKGLYAPFSFKVGLYIC
jgi:flagellar basal body-associated protein FliL